MPAKQPANKQAIDKCLPQTQCTRCSYPGCLDYAAAIYQGEAAINQCPPGGDVTIHKLAKLTKQATQPLDLEFGPYQAKTLAFIIEDQCIGCVLCIQACPVDAIVGANKLMHTVIQAHCTGCELCLPVCPTDCIEMQALPKLIKNNSDWPGYTTKDIELAKTRYERRQTRLVKQADTKTTTAAKLDKTSRQQAILDAIKRKKSQFS